MVLIFLCMWTERAFKNIYFKSMHFRVWHILEVQATDKSFDLDIWNIYHHTGISVWQSCFWCAPCVCLLFGQFIQTWWHPAFQPNKKKKDNPQMPKTCSPVLRSFKVLSSHVGCHLNFMNPCKGEKNTLCKEARLVILALLWMLILLSFSCWSCFV